MQEENYSTFVCESCKGPTDPVKYTCPYQEDVNGNYETLCNCCDSCQQNCIDDI